MQRVRQHLLPQRVRFALFATSFMPLFVLIILRQVSDNVEHLAWGGLTLKSVLAFVRFFGISVGLGVISLIGAFFLAITLRNLHERSSQGSPISVVDVRNRNAESISYIGTYIIPFMFEDYSSYFSIVSVVLLLSVIYFIYVNSTLLLINPVLNFRYSLYEVEYVDMPGYEPLPDRPKTAMILTRQNLLEEGDRLLFQRLGHKLFYAKYAPVIPPVALPTGRNDLLLPDPGDSAVSDYS